MHFIHADPIAEISMIVGGDKWNSSRNENAQEISPRGLGISPLAPLAVYGRNTSWGSASPAEIAHWANSKSATTAGAANSPMAAIVHDLHQDVARAIEYQDRIGRSLTNEWKAQTQVMDSLSISPREISRPFDELQSAVRTANYRKVIDKLSDWQIEATALRGIPGKKALADYWDLRLRQDYVNSNGILKAFGDTRQIQIAPTSRQALVAAKFVNHALLTEKILERAWALRNSVAAASDRSARNLDAYLFSSDAALSAAVEWSAGKRGDIQSADLAELTENYIQFGEKIRTTTDLTAESLEQQLKDFNTARRERIAVLVGSGPRAKARAETWHQSQNILRAGADRETARDNEFFQKTARFAQVGANKEASVIGRENYLRNISKNARFASSEDSLNGATLRGGLDLLAASNYIFSTASISLATAPGTQDLHGRIQEFELLGRDLSIGFMLADKLSVQDDAAARVLIHQLMPAARFVARAAGAFVDDAGKLIKGIGALNVAINMAVYKGLTQDPFKTLDDISSGLYKILSVPYGPLITDAIDQMLEASTDTVLHGSAISRADLLGHLSFQIAGLALTGDLGEITSVASDALLEKVSLKTLDNLSVQKHLAELASAGAISPALQSSFAEFAATSPEYAAELIARGAPKEALEEFATVAAITRAAPLELNVVEREAPEILREIPVQTPQLFAKVEKEFKNTIYKRYGAAAETYYAGFGINEALIKQRMGVAIDFYSTNPQFVGRPAEIAQHLMCIDFSAPVEIVQLNKGDNLIAWHAATDLEPKRYFSQVGVTPNLIGISEVVATEIEKGVGVVELQARIPHVYTASENAYLLSSKANFTPDFWSLSALNAEEKLAFRSLNPFDSSSALEIMLPGAVFTTGGGRQFFIGKNIMKLVK